MWANLGANVLGFGRKPLTPQAAMAPSSHAPLGVPLDAEACGSAAVASPPAASVSAAPAVVVVVSAAEEP